jgi:hypothetical protein
VRPEVPLEVVRFRKGIKGVSVNYSHNLSVPCPFNTIRLLLLSDNNDPDPFNSDPFNSLIHESDVGHGDGMRMGFGTCEFRENNARLESGNRLQHKGTDPAPVFYSELPKQRIIFDKLSVTPRVT